MTKDTTSDGLYNDPNMAQFYDLENGWGADFDFCQHMARASRSVLDLGCGTGELIANLAAQQRAVGVDPANAMLTIAKARPKGQQATWINADARTLILDQRFDLIVLTGHSFQVFLTKDDQIAVLDTIFRHLTPQGRFVFDTRNPDIKIWHDWSQDQSKRQLEHPHYGLVEATGHTTYDAATQVVTYQTNYRVLANQQMFTSSSKIKFTPKDQLSELIENAGLRVDKWLGNWQGAAFTNACVDIIPVGGLA